MNTYTLKVVEIRQETDDTITLCFKQPGLKKIKYLAGQYLTLIFRINERRYIRPYSFSSAPVVDNYLEVTVKRVLNGIVSNHIHDMIKIGDVMEVMQPMGDFVFSDRDDVKEIYLWGTGSGITPLISIAKSALSNEIGPSVHLFYGNRNSESTIFFDQIQLLNAKYPGRFFAKHFYTQPLVTDALPNTIQGRINVDVALDLLGGINTDQALHYICGAPGFKDSVKMALSKMAVAGDNVFSEDFELTKDPKDFEFIKTQIVEIQFNGSDYRVEVAKGRSILEAALDQNIELPYSCQTGSCSTCRGILKAGDVKMIGLTKERTDLELGEYLLCCTYPNSENIYIKID